LKHAVHGLPLHKERPAGKNYWAGNAVILFYPIIADNKRFAIFLTHVKSVACAKSTFTLGLDTALSFVQGTVSGFGNRQGQMHRLLQGVISPDPQFLREFHAAFIRRS
jgi:hypothetical protein